MLRAREQRRERYLNRDRPDTDDAVARFADAVLCFQRGLARGARLVAAQLSRILVEGYRSGGDEPHRGAAPPRRIKGCLRRHIDAANDKRRERSTRERQVPSLVGALVLPLRDEAEQQFAVVRRKLTGKHHRNAHNRTIGMLVSDEWQRHECDMGLLRRSAL